VFASEIRNTAHLLESLSVLLKMLLDLVTTHSGFKLARVFSQQCLVLSFAFCRFVSLSQMVAEPKAKNDYNRDGNDHQHFQSLPTHA